MKRKSIAAAPRAQGIDVKKKFGQHFLRDQSVIDTMIHRVDITPETSIFEIGCGDGFLTRGILATAMKRLWVFEIDPEWADYVAKTYPDSRMTIFQEDILSIDFTRFHEHAPWTLLANLPYQITFPILYKLYEFRHLWRESVIMVQEEVAQKIVAAPGESSVQSLFYQYYFDLELLTKIPPTAFYPPPSIYSRLIYMKPKNMVIPINQEEKFWRFVKQCFSQRRRTLKNNLMGTHYFKALSPDMAMRRAQELSMDEFLFLWHTCLDLP